MASEQDDLDRLVVEALKTVKEPTGRNIVDAGLVLSVQGEGENDLAVSCRAPGWPEAISQNLSRQIQAALRKQFPQLNEIKVRWAAPEAAVPEPAGEPGPPRIRHVVAVGSGKGGVGKSTIAASLAYGLRHRGFSVGLMDSDVYGPSIPHMLGLHEGAQVLENPLRILPPERDGIKVISMGFLVPPEKAVVWRGPMLHKAVKDFLYAVHWGELDYLIVDLPPGTGDVVLSLAQQMPLAGGVIVCTPQDVALLDARKALDMFATVKIPCLGLVENMSFFECPSCGHRAEIFGHGGAREWAGRHGLEFLGEVPINLQMRLNGDSGELGDNFREDSAVRSNLLAITDRIVAAVAAGAAPAAPAIEIA